jgi:DNA-binding LytR/AlgR family response regulator
MIKKLIIIGILTIPFLLLTNMVSAQTAKTEEMKEQTFRIIMNGSDEDVSKYETAIAKAVKKSDLFAAVSLAIDKIKEGSTNRKLKIKDGYSVQLINIDEILYIESEGNYINIYCENKKFTSRQSLDSAISEINDNSFFRIQRSYLVNTLKITKFSKREVIIRDVKLPVSRNTGDALEEYMKKN